MQASLVLILLACSQYCLATGSNETQKSTASAAYVWRPTVEGDWQNPASWVPRRNTPATNDILSFNTGGMTTAVNVPTQTIGQLIVDSNTSVKLQSSRRIVLTISGGTGDDFFVQSGSSLDLNGTASITTALGSGVTGKIEGSLNFSSAAHRLVATDAGAVTFQNGSVFTAAEGFAGNAFGTTGLNSIVFDNGSTYVSKAGGDPFGAAEPASVVVFKKGSLFTVQGNVIPSMSGRTYANFEVNFPDLSLFVTGSSAMVIDNLTLTAGNLDFGLTGNPGHSIKGDIRTQPGTSLDFQPSFPGVTFNFNGNSNQTIACYGIQGSNFGTTFVVDNPNGLTLARGLAVGSLVLRDGVVKTAGDQHVLVADSVTRVNGYVDGTLRRVLFSTGTFKFDLGTENGYSPFTLVLTSAGSFPLFFDGRAFQSAQPNISNPSKALSRHWFLSAAGAINADLIFNYLDPLDIPPTANEGNFVIEKYSGGFTQPVGTIDTTTNEFRVAGITQLGDFTLAEPGAILTPTPTSTPTTTPTNTPTNTPTATPTTTPLARVLCDFDGDRKADLSVYRPSNGLWYFDRSAGGGLYAAQLGNATDKIVPGDYDGDGKTDFAVYRPSSGAWYVLKSSTNVVEVTVFGLAADVPAPGDYDGDGRADVAVFRPSDGTWYVQRSTQGLLITQFGANGDVPAPGDYDGDGKNDLVVWRPSNGVWFERRSSGSDFAIQFGATTDKIVPADYDGDGKTDVGVYRASPQGTWYTVNSSNGAYPVTVFGLSGDIPVPADYDGDGRADIGLFRPSDRTWYVNRTTSGLLITQFGLNGDKPTENAFGN